MRRLVWLLAIWLGWKVLKQAQFNASPVVFRWNKFDLGVT